MSGELVFLHCDYCSGRNWVGGIYPRKMTRDEMNQRIRERGKVTPICVHCGRVTVLRVPPAEQSGAGPQSQGVAHA